MLLSIYGMYFLSDAQCRLTRCLLDQLNFVLLYYLVTYFFNVYTYYMVIKLHIIISSPEPKAHR